MVSISKIVKEVSKLPRNYMVKCLNTPEAKEIAARYGYYYDDAANFGAKELISIFIVVLLAAYLLPTAFDAIFSANTTGWDSGTASMFKLIAIIATIVVVVGLVYAAYRD